MQDRFKFRFFNNRGMIYEASNYSPDSTLMQCTGLKDSEGKLIYEGDIISNDVYNFIILWHDFCWYQKNIDKDRGLHDPKNNNWWSSKLTNLTCHYKIIGNIYENPELLKAVK